MPFHESPRYTRQKPEFYDELYVHAERFIEADLGADAMAGELCALVEGLSDEELEEIRYYTIGFGICDISRFLADPDNREQVIVHISESIIADWEPKNKRTPCPLTLGDTSDSHYKAALDSYSSDSRLPESVNLLYAALEAAADYRFKLRNEEPQENTQKDVMLSYIVHRDDTMAHLAEQAFSAAAIVVHTALSAMDKETGFIEAVLVPDLVEYDAVLKGQEITELDLRHVGIGCARLRLDEFVEKFRLMDCIGTDENNQPVFHRETLREAPGKPSKGYMHEARLGCPALNVPGTITAALEVVQEADSRALKYVEEVLARLPKK